jgi:large subunit ribosomal protein L22
MEVRATLKYVRVSPTRVRALARRVTGLPVDEALRVAQVGPGKAPFLVTKVLKSAIANAKNNAKLEGDHLKVKAAVVNEGPRMKRHWPRARGSASPILRRMSHIRIVLTDEAGDQPAQSAAGSRKE